LLPFGGMIAMHNIFPGALVLFAVLLVLLGCVLYRAARRASRILSPATSGLIGAGLTMAATLGWVAFAAADPVVGFLWSEALESLPSVLLIGAFVATCVGAIFAGIAALVRRSHLVADSAPMTAAAEPSDAADSR
jgi:hypothetical protein